MPKIINDNVERDTCKPEFHSINVAYREFDFISNGMHFVKIERKIWLSEDKNII
jgi:hypothetical protein